MLCLAAGIEPFHQFNLGSGMFGNHDVIDPLDRRQSLLIFLPDFLLELPPVLAAVPEPGLSLREKAGIQSCPLDPPFGQRIEEPFRMPPIRHRIEFGAHQEHINGVLDPGTKDGVADLLIIPGNEQPVPGLQCFQFLHEMAEPFADILDRPFRMEEIALPLFPPYPDDVLLFQMETVDVFNVGIEELLLGDDVIIHRAITSTMVRTSSIVKS